MKKQVLLGTVLLAAISAFSQSGRMKPQPTSLINTKLLAQTKFGGAESQGSPSAQPENTTKSPIIQSTSKTSIIPNVWNNFTSSMNAYGVSVAYTKPLQWHDELNAVSFLHRKSPSYSVSPTPASTAANGAIVAMISADCGASWDSTALYANDNFWGRFPGGAIYNPSPSNTDISNAYIVGAGPTTGAGNVVWIGNWYASKQLGVANYDNAPSTVLNAQQAMPTSGPFSPALGRHDFSAYSFTGTDDGKMRVLAGVTDDGLAADSAMMLVTGTFNTGVFDWEGTVFSPPVTVASDGSRNILSRPLMAWNESGSHGYVVIMGVRAGSTGSNEGLQPIVYKTTNFGNTWTLENGINFNNIAYASVKRSLATVNSDSTLEVPWFNFLEGMDCVVDANNKLHIFSSICGAASNHPDSTFFLGGFTSEGYRWPHIPIFQPYLYDFMYDGNATTPAWSFLVVDSMSSEVPGAASTAAGYQDNPWDGDPNSSNSKLQSSARLQLSRTPDGQNIVYTWAESDTTQTNGQKKWNSIPNVKARLMRVSTGTIHPTKINITGSAPSEIALRSMFHYVSPKCRVSTTVTTGAPSISLPMTVTNSTPYKQLTSNSHWFTWANLNFGNIPDNQIIVCGALPTTGVGMADNNFGSAASSHLYPNPAKNNVKVSINLLDKAAVQVEILNTVGQIVRSVKTDGQNGLNSIQVDLSGLSSGIYMVNVKADNASSTKKLVIE